MQNSVVKVKDQDKIRKNPSIKKTEILFLSCFGAGFFPKAPGTFASLLPLPLLYLFGHYDFPAFFLLIPLILLTLFSSFLVEIVQKKYSLHDPSWIVIDEVLGMLLAWIISPTKSLGALLLLFLFFRFFDIVKIWPASYFDKKMQHGAGVIIDDLVSGIYAGLLHFAALYSFSFL